MLTKGVHLITRRPSPTTVEFTVSTARVPTLTLRLVKALTVIFRLAFALSLVFLLYSKYLLSSYATQNDQNTASDTLFHRSLDFAAPFLLHLTSSRIGASFSLLAVQTPLWILLPTAISLLYILTLRTHTSESLLVLRGLGVQTSSSSASYLSSSTTRFIPTEKIQDILVNEAFRGWEVRYYLVVVVEGEESVVVVFPRLLPRRDVVEEVWRGARACLFEREKDEKGREKGKEREDRGNITAT